MIAGEMAAGLALGPTVFGWLAPGAFHSLFPPLFFVLTGLRTNLIFTG